MTDTQDIPLPPMPDDLMDDNYRAELAFINRNIKIGSGAYMLATSLAYRSFQHREYLRTYARAGCGDDPI